MNMLQLLRQQEIISVREFLHNFSSIIKKPKKKVYTITKNGQRVGFFIPQQSEHEIFDEPQHLEKKYKYQSIFEWIDDISFKSDDPHLSQKIDEILYGKNFR